MEVDSAHAAIERKMRQLRPSVPSDIAEVILAARANEPFNLEPMVFSDFYKFYKEEKSGKKINTFNISAVDSKKIEFQKVAWIRYLKRHPDKISLWKMMSL